MKIIRSLTFRVIAAFVFLIALLAAVDNSEKVALSFLDASTPELPISAWVLISFLLGVVFASLLNAATNARLRLAARKANSEVRKTNQTIDKIRAEQIDETELNTSG